MKSLAELITQRLAVLRPLRFDLNDDSAEHVGHAESKQSGGGHFSLMIVSETFRGQNRITRHQAVYALLSDLMPESIHALQLRALTPEE